MHIDDVTDDYNRVVLDLQDGIPDSDYINASYIDVNILNLCKFPRYFGVSLLLIVILFIIYHNLIGYFDLNWLILEHSEAQRLRRNAGP